MPLLFLNFFCKIENKVGKDKENSHPAIEFASSDGRQDSRTMLPDLGLVVRPVVGYKQRYYT